jgi:hypothetical protein
MMITNMAFHTEYYALFSLLDILADYNIANEMFLAKKTLLMWLLVEWIQPNLPYFLSGGMDRNGCHHHSSKIHFLMPYFLKKKKKLGRKRRQS